MKVPLLDLRPQLAPLREEIVAAVTELIDSTSYILGPPVERFEEEMAAYCGTARAVGVSSGTDALLVCLMALDIGPGDLVLTTPYSFFATMGSVLRVGARPVFVDIDPRTWNMDPRAMEEALERDARGERRIRAVIPVHLFGQCADMGPIMEVAERHGVPVIEDAAQAIGAEYLLDGQWRRAGSMGLAGCFSFFPSKNLGGIGDSGMVTTNDHRFADRIRSLRNHGAAENYEHSFIGGNFRLDAVQAVVLSRKLPHLDGWHQARQANARRYRELFQAAGLDDRITPPEPVYADLPGSRDHHVHIYNQFVVRAADRDGLRRYLVDHGVGCAIYYPAGLHRQDCLRGLEGYERPDLPVTDQAAASTLALPVYPELSSAMQEYVVEQIAAFYHP